MRIRTDNVTWQEIDGELVILDLKTSTYLTTNVVGALLAKHLTQERSADDLAQFLVDTFGVDPGTAHRDSAAFVDQLRARNLLIEETARA